MKRISLFVIQITVFSAATAFSQIVQTVEISSSPNPVGSGARALGMGGAFIGVADDATAASWNPAGLIQLETPEISVVAAYNDRSEDTTYKAFPEASGPQDVSTTDINYLSLAYPFEALERNMIVSLNYQHLYDFNKKVSYGYGFIDPAPPALSLQQKINYDQEGSFKSISPAIALQVTPEFSLGITLNIWNHGLYENKWESRYRSQGSGNFAGFPFNVETKIDESYTMDGLKADSFDPSAWQNVNFNLGLMWNFSPRVTLGAVFKSPFEAQLEHDYRFESDLTFLTFPAGNSYNEIRRTETVALNMPMAYGIGLALRLSDQLTLDADIYQTRWSDYALTTADGTKMNPITGTLQSDSDIDDTVQVRLGCEYLLMAGYQYIVPLRAGVFYDPEPAEGSPDDFYGFSLGSGVAYKQFVFDMAYQYRFGRDVRAAIVGNEDSTQDVDQHTVYLSVIYHF